MKTIKGAISGLEGKFEKWKAEVRDPKRFDQVLQEARQMQPALRLVLLSALEGVPLSVNQYKDFLLDFSLIDSTQTNSQLMVHFLFSSYEDATMRGILNKDILRRLGYLFAGNSFEPDSDGFGRYLLPFAVLSQQAAPEKR